MKRIVSLLLGFALMVPLLAAVGCGTKSVDYDPDNFIADTSNPQIVKDKVTIKMFVPKASIQGQWEDMFIFQYMEEVTNIHVEFEEVMLSSYSEKRGLRWESKKDPTDAFMLGNNADEVTQASALGALTPLNDPDATDEYSGNYGSLIDNYMPNYKKWPDTYEDISLATTQADGNMYAFSSVSTLYGGLATQYLNRVWLEKTDWYAANKRFADLTRSPIIEISNCLIRNKRNRGLLLQGRNVTVSNCEFSYVIHSAIQFIAEVSSCIPSLQSQIPL